MSKELAAAVRMAAESLRQNPDQFAFTIEQSGFKSKVEVHSPVDGPITGVSITASNHGTGMLVNNSVSGRNMFVVRSQAAPAMRDKVEGWADGLQTISNEMESSTPDKAFLRRALDKLASSDFPAATLTLVTALVNAAAAAS